MTNSTDGTTVNGPPSLSDRVKELRLSGRLDDGRAKAGGTAWLPWLLCFFLAVGWAGFGIKWYRGTSEKKPEPPRWPSAPPGTT